MTAAAVLVLLAAAHLLPEHLARWLGQSQAALEYMTYAIEAAALWAAVAVTSRLIAVQAAATWGAMESLQRAACRAAFPLDRPPPKIPGENLCDTALGLPMSWASLAVALFVALVAQEAQRVR